MGPFPTDEATGARYLIVACDYMTRWVEAKPIKALGGAELVTFLGEWITRYSVPRTIVLDRGSDMQSKVLKDFATKMGIELNYTAPYHHQSNLVERANRTVLNMLRCLKDSGSSWVENINACLFGYRCFRHSSTGRSPMEVLMGRPPRLPIDLHLGTTVEGPKGMTQLFEKFKEVRSAVRTRHTEAAARRAEQYDSSRRVSPRTLKPGQKVLWRKENPNSKLDAIFSGPFEIVERVSETNYVIRGDGAILKTVHVKQLKEYHGKEKTSTLRARGRPRKIIN